MIHDVKMAHMTIIVCKNARFDVAFDWRLILDDVDVCMGLLLIYVRFRLGKYV